MYLHHEKVPMEILWTYGHVAILLRRLYKHRVHDATGINCHALVTVLAEVYEETTATHGWVLGYDPKQRSGLAYQHSWLPVGDGWIIDPKPIHCVAVAPLLIQINGTMVAGHFYQEIVTGDLYRKGMEVNLHKSVRGNTTKRAATALRRAIRKIMESDPVTDEAVLDLLMEGRHE